MKWKFYSLVTTPYKSFQIHKRILSNKSSAQKAEIVILSSLSPYIKPFAQRKASAPTHLSNVWEHSYIHSLKIFFPVRGE